MKIIAAVTEFNLFHKGHIKLLEEMNTVGGEESLAVAIMSGNFVQRGEAAVLDKYLRAEAAVCCGFDLVLELPFPWSCSGAEFFARGSCSVLRLLASHAPEYEYSLCFGSETGDIDELRAVSALISDPRYLARVELERAEKKDRAESDIRLRDRIFSEMFGRGLPRTPNDILGIEYIRALTGKENIRAFTVKRRGSESATAARSAYLEGDLDALGRICPPEMVRIAEVSAPFSSEWLFPYIQSRLDFGLRALDTATDGMTHDLVYRFRSAAEKSCSLSELLESVATKKYTSSRLRRCLLLSCFGVTTQKLRSEPQEALILGAGARGRKFLSGIRGRVGSPIISSSSRASEGGDKALLADRLYAAASGKSPDYFEKKHPFIAP